MRSFFVIALVTIFGCIEDPNPNYSIRAKFGLLHGYQNETLADPIKLEIIDQNGIPVEGIPIEAIPEIGSGKVLSTSKSDKTGLAEIQWELGEDFRQALEVSISGVPNSSIRISANAKYNYLVPITINDGWETKDINEFENINSTLIFDGIDKIRSGEYSEVHSLLVIKNGKLAIESYFPGHNSKGEFINYSLGTPHEQQSASKSYRSMLLGIAIEEGFIESINSPLYSFFPKYSEEAKDGKEKINLEHLLTMSTGLSWNEWVQPPNNLTTMYSLPFANWHEYVLERPLEYEPGSRFVYNTGASIMINRVIENASGMNIADFTKKYFMDRTESILLPNNANLQAKKLPRDMAKLGQIYLDGGKWKDTRLVDSSWIEKSLTSAFIVPQVNAEYGYQWWIKNYRNEGISYRYKYASGNGGQFIMIVDELNLVVVLTGGNFGGGGFGFTLMEKHILPAF